jgi:photosystem II stability/assembly factor-like uncharacterized protein
MTRLNIILLGALLVLLMACTQIIRGTMSTQLSTAQNANAEKNTNIVSKIFNVETSLWQWYPVNLKSRNDLIDVQILDAANILILDDHGRLHKTTDGGKTWRETNIGNSLDGSVSSFHFINPAIGWATIIKKPSDVLDSDGFQSQIINTNDGGQSWYEQYSATALHLTRVLFTNEREGWVTGSRLVKRETLQNEYVVLHTTTQGDNWTDVSDKLGRDLNGGFVEDIYSEEPFKAMILTSGRKLFLTTDGGQNWQRAGALQDEPTQTAMIRTGRLDNNRAWVLGGADGREGIWTLLAIKDKQDSWSKYRVDNVYLSGISFLSDNNIIACGSMRVGIKSRTEGGGREGVILNSSDGGHTWSVIYRNTNIERINSLSSINSREIWAVGEGGLIIHLEAIS